jgi:hypothetical protein
LPPRNGEFIVWSDANIANAFLKCVSRWQDVLNPELRREAWTKEEDEALLKIVQEQNVGELIHSMAYTTYIVQTPNLLYAVGIML